VQSPLRDVGGAHAVKSGVGEVAEPREVVESVGPEGSPVAMQLEHEGALGGLEPKPRHRRGRARELGVGGVEQQRAGGGGCSAGRRSRCSDGARRAMAGAEGEGTGCQRERATQRLG